MDTDALVAEEAENLPEDYGRPSYAPTQEKEEKVSAERWYVLLMFSLFTLTQGGVWNTWGPISDSANFAFGWTNQDIALLANWGPIAYLISSWLFAWILDVKGLRWACLISHALVTLGTGLRCITSTPPAVSWLIHVGQLLNGLGGPVAMSTPPVISAIWFPAQQRTTSTAIGTMANGLGVALFFILGPQMVRQPSTHNTTNTTTTSSPDNSSNKTGPSNVEEVRADIMYYMYILFIWCAVLMVLFLLRFPAKPKHPPSTTASVQRTDFKEALPKLFRHVKFWILAFPYGLANGVYNSWGSVLDVNLSPIGIKQDEAGWLGFYGTTISVFTSVIVARFADFLSRRMKLFLLISFGGSFLAFLWFTFLCEQIIPFQIWQAYTSFIVASILIQAAVPLFYELVCESTYPIAEGVTNSMLTTLNNLSALIFLGVLMIPGVGTAWMNWFLVGSIVVCIPVLLLLREKYQRLDIDTHVVDTPVETPNSSLDGAQYTYIENSRGSVIQ